MIRKKKRKRENERKYEEAKKEQGQRTKSMMKWPTHLASNSKKVPGDQECNNLEEQIIDTNANANTNAIATTKTTTILASVSYVSTSHFIAVQYTLSPFASPFHSPSPVYIVSC
eukprot:TRINITY_DN9578_c0_g1_i1.p1 TRINITY_DN9578_c0_g1~~TRINITY_DN9578_c0_g1_i1.p1  ORF type:complete len:114 (+),score=29.36 TRINITY_DN9578_c0_g1_i1:155-496(+)